MNWRRGLLRTWIIAAGAWVAFACLSDNPVPQLMTPRAHSDPAPVLLALNKVPKSGVYERNLIHSALEKADAAGQGTTARQLGKMWVAAELSAKTSERLKAAGFTDQEIMLYQAGFSDAEIKAAEDGVPVESLSVTQNKAIANAHQRDELEFKARQAVEAYQPVNKWAVLGRFSALALLPPLLLLVVALAVGWVLRGFRGEKSAASPVGDGT